MNERELIQKSFSPLHASENTLEEVMNKAHRTKPGKRIPKRIAVLAAIFAMLFSTALGTYAIKQSYEPVASFTPSNNPGAILSDAFGNKISTEKAELEDAYGNPIEVPDMERIPIDSAEAQRLVGDYTYDVNGVLTVGDHTFTFHNFLIDETGCGIIIWTLENPNGVIYREAGYGQIYFPEESPLQEPELRHYKTDSTEKLSNPFLEKEYFTTHLFNTLLSTNEDGTQIKVVSYFGTYADYEPGHCFTWEVHQVGSRDDKKIHLPSVEPIPVKKMTSAQGMELEISNFSFTLKINTNDFCSQRKAVVHFKDGTQYCVDDPEGMICNVIGVFVRDHNGYRTSDVSSLFNRLIDLNEISYVEVVAEWDRKELVGNQYEYVTQEETYLFYP